MRINIKKDQLPTLSNRVINIKGLESYLINGYEQVGDVLNAPSQDLPLSQATDIARLGVVVEAYEYWVEVPNANINDNLPEGVSYRDYVDENEVAQIRTWAELSERAANLAGTATLRFWQPVNNTQFLWNDVETIEEAGFKVLGKQSSELLLNQEYEDTGDPDYVAIETIPYIDQNWATTGSYFDMVHAHIRMREIYNSKGVDDNARWAASTDEEKEILVRWNQVGLNKASQLADPSWSEGRTFKEIGRKYREFNVNLIIATGRRFNDWYEYLNTIFSNSGKTKFASDWDWNLRDEYVSRYLRQFELNDTNALVDFNNVILGSYLDSDFVGTIPASTLVNNLEKVLVAKTYPI